MCWRQKAVVHYQDFISFLWDILYQAKFVKYLWDILDDNQSESTKMTESESPVQQEVSYSLHTKVNLKETNGIGTFS